LLNKIIEYVEQGKFVCGLVLQDQGKRLRILNQNGREMNLPVARVVHQGTVNFSHETREETMRFLKETADRRQSWQQDINLMEIWELAIDENQDSFSARFLAELVFDEDAGDDQIAAFVRAVFSDRVLFRYKDGHILVHSAEKVDQLRDQQEKEKAKELLLCAGSTGLSSLMNGNDPVEWPERDYCLGVIRDYYLYGNDAQESGLARDLLKRAGLTRPHDPFHILVKAGIWDKDENIHLHRQQVAVAFNDEVLKAAQQQEFDIDLLLATGRRDLRDLPLLTIDGEFTRDFDDALHVDKVGENYQVGIHITDVSEVVQPGNLLFEEAQSRGTSIYFADQHIPMLPPALSEELCSLIEGKVRPALSFLVTMSASGEIRDYKIVRSVVQVKRRITYSQAEHILGTDTELKTLYGLAMKFQQHRVESGAVIIPIPDVDISFPGEGKIKVALNPVDSKARTLVAELMVLANFLPARIAGLLIPLSAFVLGRGFKPSLSIMIFNSYYVLGVLVGF